MEAGNSCWELNLWWEASPRVLHAELSSWLQMKKKRDVRDEGAGVTRAGAKVRELHFEFQYRGSDVQVTCGSGQRHVNGDRGKPAVALVEGSFVSGPRPKFVGWVFFQGASELVLK